MGLGVGLSRVDARGRVCWTGAASTWFQIASSSMFIDRSTATSMRSALSRSAFEKRPVGPVNWNCFGGVLSIKIAVRPSAAARSAAVTPTGPPPMISRSNRLDFCTGFE